MLKIETKKQGAELVSITFDKQEMLHDGIQCWQRHAPVLFPIVGQLKNGESIIDGRIFKMGQHGFARDMEFEEINKGEESCEYVLDASEETLKKYPYKFSLYIKYSIQENTLTTQYKVVNKDNKEMIFGLGGHPALKCDYSSENYDIIFNEEENNPIFLKLEKGLISEEKGENIIKENKIALTKDIFSNDAIIMTNLKSNKVILHNNKENKDILEFDFTNFPYLALWSKKGAPFVCIEPWLNTTDETDSDGIFEHKNNILKLKQNEEFKCEYKIKFLNK